MRLASPVQVFLAAIVTVSIATVTPAAAFTVTVDPLPTLTFPEKKAPKQAPDRACTPATTACTPPRAEN